MPKITLSSIGSLRLESAVTNLNANFEAIEDAFQIALFRNGETPNQMNSSLDMNNFRIHNLPAPVGNNDPVRKIDIENLTGGSLQAAPITGVSVLDFGYVGDGIADDTEAIRAARNSLVNSGGVVWFPPSVARITGVILGLPNVFFQGAGSGNFLFPNTGRLRGGTEIVWDGGVLANEAMFRFSAPDDFIYATGMAGFVLNGNNQIARGVWGRSMCNSRWEDLSVRGVTETAYYLDALNSTSTTYSQANDLSNLTFGMSGTGVGLVMDGSPTEANGGCAFNVVRNLRGSYVDGIGVHLRKGDDNVFISCSASRATGGTGQVLVLGGSDNPAPNRAALGNWFFGFRGGGGVDVPVNITAQGGSWPSRGNHVFMTGIDSRVIPIIEDGAEFYYYDTGGYNNNDTIASAISPPTIFRNYRFNSPAYLNLEGHGDVRPQYITKYAKGTPKNPTTVANGEAVEARLSQAWLPTATTPAYATICNQIVDIAGGAPSATSYPARWRMQLTKVGSIVLETVVQITSTIFEVFRPLKVPSYTVATVPSAVDTGIGTIIHVSDGNGGTQCMAFSNGVEWRRMNTPSTAISAT